MRSIVSTVNVYLAKRAAVAALAVTAALTVPVVLTILFLNLPKAAFFTGLMWSMLHGTALTVLYHTMPVLVAVGIIWSYDLLFADRSVTALHSAGMSPRAIVMPALVVAVAATIIGYAVSGHFAPGAARHVHEALRSMRQGLNPDLVKVGQFNRLDDRVPVVYFSKRLDKKRFGDAFILHRLDSNEERVYVAREAVFSYTAKDSAILLVDGSVQIFRRDRDQAQVVEFQRLGLPGDIVGNLSTGPPRRFFDEFTTPELLATYRGLRGDPARVARWSMEAFKRFAIPLLTLVHSFLGLVLLMRWGDMTGRSRFTTLWTCIVVIGFHFVIVVMSEQVARLGAWFVWPILALTVFEASLALALSRGHLDQALAALRSILPTSPARCGLTRGTAGPTVPVATLFQYAARQAFLARIAPTHLFGGRRGRRKSPEDNMLGDIHSRPPASHPDEPTPAVRVGLH